MPRTRCSRPCRRPAPVVITTEMDVSVRPRTAMATGYSAPSLTGNVTLEAAAGVEANLDAVRQGDAGSGARQSQPGIIVDASANSQVVIRNIQSRNWTSGFQIKSVSRVALEGVRAEHNLNYGVEIDDSARVSISDSEVSATGRRVNPATGIFPSAANRPDPGRESSSTADRPAPSTSRSSTAALAPASTRVVTRSASRSSTCSATVRMSLDVEPTFRTVDRAWASRQVVKTVDE